MVSAKVLERRYKTFTEQYLGGVTTNIGHLTDDDIRSLIQVVTSSSNKVIDGLEGILIGDYNIDKSILSDLSKEERAVVVFIAGHQIKKPHETYHNSARIKEIREFLFDYWKKNNPKKFEEVTRKTIAEALEDEYDSRFRHHFTELIAKSAQDISLLDIEPKEYAKGFSYRNTTTPFREACKLVVHSLVNRVVLQFMGNRLYVSVNPKYLTT